MEELILYCSGAYLLDRYYGLYLEGVAEWMNRYQLFKVARQAYYQEKLMAMQVTIKAGGGAPIILW